VLGDVIWSPLRTRDSVPIPIPDFTLFHFYLLFQQLHIFLLIKRFNHWAVCSSSSSISSSIGLLPWTKLSLAVITLFALSL